jgi:hypothetical protein
MMAPRAAAGGGGETTTSTTTFGFFTSVLFRTQNGGFIVVKSSLPLLPLHCYHGTVAYRRPTHILCTFSREMLVSVWMDGQTRWPTSNQRRNTRMILNFGALSVVATVFLSFVLVSHRAFAKEQQSKMATTMMMDHDEDNHHTEEEMQGTTMELSAASNTIDASVVQSRIRQSASLQQQAMQEDSDQPVFPKLSAVQASGKKVEYRRIRCPPHRYTPLREHWEQILTPLVEYLKLQVRRTELYSMDWIY